MSNLDNVVVAPVAPVEPAPVHPEAAKRAQALAAGKAQAKANKSALRNTVVAAVRAIIGDDAKTKLAELDLKAQQLERMKAIVTPFETLGKLTGAQLEAFRDEAAAIFLVDISSRNPDAGKAAKNASVKATHLFNAMLAASQGFTVEVAVAEPYFVTNYTKFHEQAAKYLKDGKNGATIEAPTPQRKGAQTRTDNLESGKTTKPAKLDKVTTAAMTAAKVTADEQKSFLDQCSGKAQLSASLYYLARKDMARARRWVVAFTEHYDAVDKAITDIVKPQGKGAALFD